MNVIVSKGATCQLDRRSRDQLSHVTWDATIGFGLLAVIVVFVFGPFEPHPDNAAWDVTWERGLAIIAALAAARHIRHPVPWVGAHVARRLRQRLWSESSGVVLSAGLGSRVAVLAVALAVALAAPIRPNHQRVSDDPVWNAVSRWDAFWYQNIAENGYQWDPARPDAQWNVAFFPAFPIAMRMAGTIVSAPLEWLGRSSFTGETMGARLHLGGWLVSVLSFVWAMGVLYELARSDLGAVRASWAIVLLAYYPFAFFFSAPYSESLFLLATTSAFLSARQQRPLATFLWGALAATTRQTGVVLAIPLVMIALGSWWAAGRPWRDRPGPRAALVVGAMGPIVGIGLHMVHLWMRVGDPLAWVKAQAGWWSSDSWMPFVVERIRAVDTLGWWGYLQESPGRAIGTFVPLLVLIVLRRVWQISPAYTAFVVLTLAPAIAIDTPSLGRVSAPLFPVFIGLAALLPASRHAIWLVLVFGAGQLWAASVFFDWGHLF
jgi:hypothetical protein